MDTTTLSQKFEVVTEGKDLEECRAMLRDALNEMVLAYLQRQFDRITANELCKQTEIKPKF